MVQVILTDHAKYRLLERKIDAHEAKMVAKNRKVTKTEPDGTMVKVGISSNGKSLEIVCKKEGNKIIIKTAY